MGNESLLAGELGGNSLLSVLSNHPLPCRAERYALSTFFVPVVRAPMARTGQATYHEENDSTFCESMT
jgi:hypothetical protein